MPDAQEVSTANVCPLPPTVEESGEWSEEDIRDLMAFSLQYAADLYPEEEDNRFREALDLPPMNEYTVK